MGSLPQTPLSPPTTYFGYGSNLWQHQMTTRCPTSTYLGVARLPHYTWQINTRGYANVVSAPSSSPNYSDSVYGLVYGLPPLDEQQLDRNEGVPVAYTKEWIKCDFWPGGVGEKIDTEMEPKERREMLVYVDRKRTTPDVPREEYVYRMNRGIRDALALGVPEGYVEGVLRGYIAAPEGGKGGEGGKEEEELAMRQAGRFVDESGVF